MSGRGLPYALVALVAILAGTLFGGPLAAQDTTSAARAIVILPDNSRFEVSDLVIDGGQVSFWRDRAGQTTMGLPDIAAIRVHRGTRAKQYALIGAGIGVVSAVLAVAQTEAQFGDEEVSAAPWILGFGLGFGLLGAVIGSTSDVWEGIYANDGSAVGFEPALATNHVGVKVRIRLPAF